MDIGYKCDYNLQSLFDAIQRNLKGSLFVNSFYLTIY